MGSPESLRMFDFHTFVCDFFSGKRGQFRKFDHCTEIHVDNFSGGVGSVEAQNYGKCIHVYALLMISLVECEENHRKCLVFDGRVKTSSVKCGAQNH